MSSTEIRKFINLLESAHVDPTQQLLNEVFDSENIEESILDTIKNKIKIWSAKTTDAASILPALQDKWHNTIEKIRQALGTDIADKLESTLSKKAGSDWISNAGKVAAALAVATSLLSNPAGAQDLATKLGLGIVGGMQYAQTRPGYMPHKDPNVVYGQMSPEQAAQLHYQQQMQGQQIPQHVLNALVGAALSQLLYPQKIK